MTIAALFVEPGGTWANRPGVDAWPESRDARRYNGPHPVVAHPPCNRWAYTLAPLNEKRYGYLVGSDGGCFKSALTSLQTWGGVLEHPAHSLAWAAFGIPKPARGSWLCVRPGLWTTEVHQVQYGHPARKPTWLLYWGEREPFDLDWGTSKGTARVSFSKAGLYKNTLPSLSRSQAIHTPPAFADVLHALADHSKGTP
jgi:hypothetical protein